MRTREVDEDTGSDVKTDANKQELGEAVRVAVSKRNGGCQLADEIDKEATDVHGSDDACQRQNNHCGNADSVNAYKNGKELAIGGEGKTLLSVARWPVTIRFTVKHVPRSFRFTRHCWLTRSLEE